MIRNTLGPRARAFLGMLRAYREMITMSDIDGDAEEMLRSLKEFEDRHEDIRWELFFALADADEEQDRDR